MDRRLLLRKGFVKLDPSVIVVLFAKCQKRVASIRPWPNPEKMLKSRTDPGKSSALGIYYNNVISSGTLARELLNLPQTLDQLLVF